MIIYESALVRHVMKKTAFKTEVFLTVPLTFLAFVLICLSLVTQEWVSGKGIIQTNSTRADPENFGEIRYNFGLFRGQKSRILTSTTMYSLQSEKHFIYFLYSLKSTHCAGTS